MAGWHALLACPHCGAELAEAGGALACASGHSFDIARQGYVNLLPGDATAGTADTREMVGARSAFLARGHFRPLDAALADAVVSAVGAAEGCVIDVGAGTGEHLAAVLERLPGRTGLALDISKHAARRAARAHPRVGAAVCDAWGTLPVRDGVAAAVMCVFAPRNAPEFARILAASGVLVVVTPTSRHLQEIAGPLGLVSVDPRKEERLETALGGHFERAATRAVEREMRLSREDVLAAALMGPSAHHLQADDVESRVASLPEPIAVTLSVSVSTWQLMPGR
ncbi:MAG: methyltransferase domain-containing protein [Coriobacteriia bacterium]